MPSLVVWMVSQPNPGADLTRPTIWLALLCYLPAAMLMLSLDGDGWCALTTTGRAARLWWSLACLAYLIHVGMAFHYHHGWSHAQAVRHVERNSGFGPGIFVSYLFTLLWTVDAGWWWLGSRQYAERPAWIGWVLHGFMAFIIFNGAVVFATGFIRWAGVVLFVVLGACLVWTRRPLLR